MIASLRGTVLEVTMTAPVSETSRTVPRSEALTGTSSLTLR